MKFNLFVTIMLFCFSTTAFAEGLWTHSCDPKSAWFSEKISSGIQTASLDTETLLKVMNSQFSVIMRSIWVYQHTKQQSARKLLTL